MGVSDVVRLFDLLRSTVQFLESHPPRSGRGPRAVLIPGVCLGRVSH